DLTPDQRPMAPSPVIAYKVFLQDIVTRELMAVEATRRPRPLTAAEQADVDSLWHVLARNQLFIEEVGNRVSVDSSHADLFRYDLTHIPLLPPLLSASQEEAQAWYTRTGGATPVSRLEAAAKQGGSGAPQEIDLGHKIREDFNDENARILFTLAPGRLSP